MIAILDYGSGNIKAITNIYNRLNVPTFVARTATDLDAGAKIVLPGVGAFDQAMQYLCNSGLAESLRRRVIDDGVPLIGICVGMQLLARGSEEGQLPGLGWLAADVRRLDHGRVNGRTHLPHMGWNEISPRGPHPLFDGLSEDRAFYFLHSYYMSCDSPDDVIAHAEYGQRFACAVGANNVYGVQFHPEKSHGNGVRVLKNFAEL